MRYGWYGWPGLGMYLTLTSPINLMPFDGPVVTLCGWWVLKKWLNLAIEVSWLSLKEPECDFISFVCALVWMVELPLVGDLIGDSFRTQRKLFFCNG